jgi:hypothetical protein
MVCKGEIRKLSTVRQKHCPLQNHSFSSQSEIELCASEKAVFLSTVHIWQRLDLLGLSTIIKIHIICKYM